MIHIFTYHVLCKCYREINNIELVYTLYVTHVFQMTYVIYLQDIRWIFNWCIDMQVQWSKICFSSLYMIHMMFQCSTVWYDINSILSDPNFKSKVVDGSCRGPGPQSRSLRFFVEMWLMMRMWSPVAPRLSMKVSNLVNSFSGWSYEFILTLQLQNRMHVWKLMPLL